MDAEGDEVEGGSGGVVSSSFLNSLSFLIVPR